MSQYFTKKNFKLYGFFIKKSTNNYYFSRFICAPNEGSSQDYSNLINLDDNTPLTNQLYLDKTMNELVKTLNSIRLDNYLILNLRRLSRFGWQQYVLEVNFQQKKTKEELIEQLKEEIILLRNGNGQNPYYEQNLDIQTPYRF